MEKEARVGFPGKEASTKGVSLKREHLEKKKENKEPNKEYAGSKRLKENFR